MNDKALLSCTNTQDANRNEVGNYNVVKMVSDLRLGKENLTHMCSSLNSNKIMLGHFQKHLIF